MGKILNYFYLLFRALFERKKPDGSDFSLPVEVVSGGSGGGVSQVEGKDVTGSDTGGGTVRPVLVGGANANDDTLTRLALSPNGQVIAEVEGKDEGDSDAGSTSKPIQTGFLNSDGFVTYARGESNGAARVSLYGKGQDAGDTPLKLTPSEDEKDPVEDQLTVASFPFLFNGTTFDRQRTPSVVMGLDAAEAGSVWGCPVSKRIRLMGGVVMASADGVYSLGPVNGVNLNLPLKAGVPFTLPPMGNGFTTAVSTDLSLGAAPGTSLTGYLFGTEE